MGFKEIFSEGSLKKLLKKGFPKEGEPVAKPVQWLGTIGKITISVCIGISALMCWNFATRGESLCWGFDFLFMLSLFLIQLVCALIVVGVCHYLKKKGRNGQILYGISLKWIVPAFLIICVYGLVFVEYKFPEGSGDKFLTSSEKRKKSQERIKEIMDPTDFLNAFRWDDEPIPPTEKGLAYLQNPSQERRLGFIMGVTTLEEAKKILKDRGATFSESTWRNLKVLKIDSDPWCAKYVPFLEARMEFTYNSKKLYDYTVYFKHDQEKTMNMLKAIYTKKGFKKAPYGNDLIKKGTRIDLTPLFSSRNYRSVSFKFWPLDYEAKRGDMSAMQAQVSNYPDL